MNDGDPPPRPSPDELPHVVEALLLAAEEPLGVGALARAAGAGEGAVRRALERLAAECAGRGLRLQEDGGRHQLVTAPEYAPYVARLLGDEGAQRLSRAALETLTVVAYRQPCSRGEVEAVRGVNSDRIVASLERRGLLEGAGRARTPGRPRLYRPAARFYEHFGLLGPADLPPLPDADEPERAEL